MFLVVDRWHSFTDKNDVILFEFVYYDDSHSKSNGTVIGQTRLLPDNLPSHKGALSKEIYLDVYKFEGLKIRGQLAVRLKRYLLPSALILPVIPSPPLLSPALPPGLGEHLGDDGRVYYADHNTRSTSLVRLAEAGNSNHFPNNAISPGFPNHLGGSYTGLAEASRDAILRAFPDSRKSQAKRTSLNERSNSIEHIVNKIVNPVRCLRCSRSFEDLANLTYHIKMVHGIVKLLRCRHCYKAFEDASNMEYHIKRNHVIQCPNCPRSVEGLENLAYHMSQSHPARPKCYIYTSQDRRANLIKCPECNNKFQSSENLAWHMKQAHLIIMLRKCPQCHQNFEARFELESHFKVSHPNSDPREISEPQLPYYACVKCDKTFSCQESLSTHEQEKHGSGHPVVPTSRKNSQQIEESSQGSHSEKAAETQFLTEDEQEKYDRALAIRFQEEEEKKEKERALWKQEDRALSIQLQEKEEEEGEKERALQKQEDERDEHEIIPPATEFQPVPMRTQSPASTLSRDTLSDRLSVFFLNRPNTRYSDAEIAEISRLLKCSGSDWSKVPRTYIILRTINSLHILEDLLAKGFTDHWFPVTLQALQQLKSPTSAIRSAIVDHQGIILTRSIDLEKGEAGKHQHFPKGELLPFQTLGILGTGGFGQVDRVRSIISYKEYARKRVRRRNVFGNGPAAAVKAFISEVEILKRLKHRHIVEFAGSYTDPTCFGIIMSPVAEMDLAKYLSIAKPEHNPTLRTYFGCLTAALQYLHDNRIRHKDIKPQNILVDQGNVLLTDFGLSRDSTGVSSTTSGFTSLSYRYCAPEVAMHNRRNSSSDIWSLGCVFLEMFVVLKGHNLDWMKDYFAHHGSGEFYVRTNPLAEVEMISELEKIEPKSDNRVIEWVQEMLQVDRNARPTATEIIASITGQDKYNESSSAFCGMCCSYGDESSEAEDSMDEELFGGTQP